MIKPNTLREKLIKLAYLQHHKPYIHGDHGPDSFDCAGLVWYLYHEILDINIYENGIGISTTTRIMTSTPGILTRYSENIDKDLTLIKEGDILLFHTQSKEDNEPKETNKYPGHAGIYLGDNKFMHASSRKGMVIISSFNKEKWVKKLVGSKNIIK